MGLASGDMVAASERRAVARDITAEMVRIPAGCRGEDASQPRLDYPPYRSSALRHRSTMTNLLWPGDHRADELMSDRALLRERAEASVRGWIHRGLTSQDVLDTALMLTVRDVVDDLEHQLANRSRHFPSWRKPIAGRRWWPAR